MVEDKIMNFFSDSKFQKEIRNTLHEIREKIKNEFINKKLDEDLRKKISKELNERIKSKESLQEKLKRKGYLNKWNINEEDEEKSIKKKLCKNLSDLIGFRINCYFKEEEKIIFEKLVEYLSENKDIEVEKNINTKQKNGFDIYKVSCKYKKNSEIFCFEIQVKSFLNDVWGEVEHSIIYKNKLYDSQKELKKEIMVGIYNILDGTDRQLQKIYTSKDNIENIKYELFFLYSHEKLECDSSISLGNHYENFFKLVNEISDSKKSIDQYLGEKLLGNDYEKKKINEIKSDEIESDIKIYEEAIDSYKWEMICKIAKILYDFETDAHFLKYIINKINEDEKKIEKETSDDDFDTENDIFVEEKETYSDGFDTKDDVSNEKNIFKNVMNRLFFIQKEENKGEKYE